MLLQKKKKAMMKIPAILFFWHESGVSNLFIKFNDVTLNQLLTRYKEKQLSLYVTEAIQGKQLNHQLVLCCQEMPVIFFKYFILIIIVESKYFKTFVLLFACSEAELRLTVITVRNDLRQNVPPISQKYRSNWSIRAIPLAQLLLRH